MALALALLGAPQFSFGFSETEIDTLESTGGKRLSPSPWRTQISFSLQRNLEVESRYTAQTGETGELISWLDPNKEASLLDPSNFYYALYLALNYSLSQIESSLKGAEIFLNSSFSSSFTGYAADRKGYRFPKDYILDGLGDFAAGGRAPLFRSGKFFSEFSLSFAPFPLSYFSRKAGLSSRVSGAAGLLYFLSQEDRTGIALESHHSLSYSQYEKESADQHGNRKNIPWDTSQSLSLICRQGHSDIFPANIRLSASYWLGINTNETRFHDLKISLSSSWKLRERLYLSLIGFWKDRMGIHNPHDREYIEFAKNPLNNSQKMERLDFSLNRLFFILTGSFSF